MRIRRIGLCVYRCFTVGGCGCLIDRRGFVGVFHDGRFVGGRFGFTEALAGIFELAVELRAICLRGRCGLAREEQVGDVLIENGQ